jgi:hypothetical protein
MNESLDHFLQTFCFWNNHKGTDVYERKKKVDIDRFIYPPLGLGASHLVDIDNASRETWNAPALLFVLHIINVERRGEDNRVCRWCFVIRGASKLHRSCHSWPSLLWSDFNAGSHESVNQGFSIRKLQRRDSPPAPSIEMVLDAFLVPSPGTNHTCSFLCFFVCLLVFPLTGSSRRTLHAAEVVMFCTNEMAEPEFAHTS